MSGGVIDRAILEAAQAEGIEVREDYSGRGMYGGECFGIVGSLNGLLTFAAILAGSCDNEEEAADVLSDLAQAAQEDSMGRQSIYYFPGWTFKEES